MGLAANAARDTLVGVERLEARSLPDRVSLLAGSLIRRLSRRSRVYLAELASRSALLETLDLVTTDVYATTDVDCRDPAALPPPPTCCRRLINGIQPPIERN